MPRQSNLHAEALAVVTAPALMRNTKTLDVPRGCGSIPPKNLEPQLRFDVSN